MANKELKTKITLRNDVAAKWVEANPVLLKGEIGLETDTNKFKVGDGVKRWNELGYFVGDVNALLQGYLSKAEYKGSADGVVKEADKLHTARTINGVAFDGTKDITVADNTKIPNAAKGQANGVATLGEDGKVPAGHCLATLTTYWKVILTQINFTKKTPTKPRLTANKAKSM